MYDSVGLLQHNEERNFDGGTREYDFRTSFNL
jgi:hypothetical protein